MHFIRTLKEIHRGDRDLVGERAEDLAILSEKGFSVPLSFVLTNEAFEQFISENALQTRVAEALTSANKQRSYETVRELILNRTVPQTMVSEIVEGYESLSINEQSSVKDIVKSEETPIVSVILSPNHSLPNENNEGVILNVKGLEQLLIAIKECWACLFTPDLQAHREAGIGSTNLNVGVIIQRIPNGEITAEGWSATAGNIEELTVKSYFGMMDLVNECGKDEFRLTREYLKPTYQSVEIQNKMLTRDENDQLDKVPLGTRGEEQKVTDRTMIEIGRLVKKASGCLDKQVKMFFSLQNDILTVQLCNTLLTTTGSVKLDGYQEDERIEETVDPDVYAETEPGGNPDEGVIIEHVHEEPAAEAPEVIEEVQEEDQTIAQEPSEPESQQAPESDPETAAEPTKQEENTVEESAEPIIQPEEQAQPQEEVEQVEEPAASEHAPEQPEEAPPVTEPSTDESIFSGVELEEQEPSPEETPEAPANERTIDEAYSAVTDALRKRYEARFNNLPPENPLDMFDELKEEIIIPHQDEIELLLERELDQEQEEKILQIIDPFLQEFL